MQAKRLAWALFILVAAGFAETIEIPAKRHGAGPLFRIERGGKWGFMDRRGKTVISPQFDYARDYFGGLAGVFIKDKWGYIDERGNVKIKPQYDEIQDFLGALAPVLLGKRWGYIDKTGKVVVPFDHQEAYEFHDGLARVGDWTRTACTDRIYGLEEAPAKAFKLDWGFSDTGRPCLGVDTRYEFVDESGKRKFSGLGTRVWDFSESLAMFEVGEYPDTKIGFIDTAGAIVIPAIFFSASDFHEGLAPANVGGRIVGNRVEGNQRGYIDRTGRFVIAAEYDYAGDFSEGLARVMTVGVDGANMRYIDKAGKTVISGPFNEAWDFHDGRAAVFDRSGWHLIDKTGARVLPAVRQFTVFSDGLAIIGKTSNRIYIDTTGREIARYD
ncbi:MAG: WG repeat-containing protein [Bryobacteraceae bacterium]